MKTYELQVYQNGAWKFDSYFDQRDMVLSEAERIDQFGQDHFPWWQGQKRRRETRQIAGNLLVSWLRR